MKILLGIIAVETLVITVTIFILWLVGKKLAITKEKLKVAYLQIASMEAVYSEMQRIKTQTAKNVEKLSDTQACIDYLAGGENGQN